MEIQRRGMLLVLSSPSGAGKTTLTRQLLAEEKDRMMLSVSATTRPPRPSETDGIDYHFLDNLTFGEMRNREEFFESAKVFDNYYGTPIAPVIAAQEAGKDVVFDIDWQGTQQIEEKAADDLVKIFVLPPSVAELERRLTSRAADSPQIVSHRMSKAAAEITHYTEYDYIIVNHNIEQSLIQVRAIVASERLKRKRQKGLSDFVQGLQQSL
ncbi:MAG: guanylate kinase [Alphaproteobacteria bacterium]|nr:guanylate kinase [Alphaproteobacteria bacterium]